MQAPSADRIRRVLPLIDWATRGFPPPASGEPDPLDALVAVAIAYVVDVTGRPQDESMPDALVPVAEMADALATLALMSDVNEEQLDALSGGDVLAGFSADGYSETYRDPGVALKAMREALMVHPWPPLNRLLWMLMTPDKRAYWMGFLQGGGIPSYGVVEIDWSGQNRNGGWGAPPGSGGLPGDWGWGGVPGVSDIPVVGFGGDGSID